MKRMKIYDSIQKKRNNILENKFMALSLIKINIYINFK